MVISWSVLWMAPVMELMGELYTDCMKMDLTVELVMVISTLV